MLKLDIVNNIDNRSLPAPNPVTREKHRRELFFQVTLPLILVAVLIVLTAVIVTAGSMVSVSKLADISLIWLIIPMLIVGLISFALIVVFIYGIVKLVQVLPIYASQVYTFVLAFGFQINRIGDKSVEPILRIQAFTASIGGLAHSIRRTGNRKLSDK